MFSLIASDANLGQSDGTKTSTLGDQNLPATAVTAPRVVDSGWGYGHWQGWEATSNIATNQGAVGSYGTPFSVIQPCLYLYHIIKA